MKRIRLNIRGATFLVLSVLLNGVKHSQMSDNHMNVSDKDHQQAEKANMRGDNIDIVQMSNEDETLPCPSNLNCRDLQYPCIECAMNKSCTYGDELNVTCVPKTKVKCNGTRSFRRTMICRYCYQTEHWEHHCPRKANCNSVAMPRQYYRTNCSVNNDIICLGQRIFPKKLICNWTRGYRWSTTLALSITLGGFGADRFYLGHWQEGIGKLFSFGGLGVWTLIDVILISLHYLGPADGSLYL